MVMFSSFLLLAIWLGVISNALPVLGRPTGLPYPNGTSSVRGSILSPLLSPKVENATTVTTPASISWTTPNPSDSKTLTAVSSCQDAAPAAMKHHSLIDISFTAQNTDLSRAVVCNIHGVPTPCSTLSDLTSAETTPSRTKLTHALTLPATTASDVPSAVVSPMPTGNASATASPPGFTPSQIASTSAAMSPSIAFHQRPAALPAHNNTVHAMCRVGGSAMPCSAVEKLRTVSASSTSFTYAGWGASRTSITASFPSVPPISSIILPFRNTSALTTAQTNHVFEPTASATRTISIHGVFFEHDATRLSASTLFTVAHANEVRTASATPSPSASFYPGSNDIYKCGDQAFRPSKYTCWDDTTLCPVTNDKRLEACGGGCFDPEQYACTDGVLVSIQNGKLPDGTAATATPIPIDVWPSSAATVVPTSIGASSSSTNPTSSDTSAASTTAAVAPTAVPPDDSKDDDDDLSSGQIAAIATSTTTAALLFFLISILLFRRRNARIRKAMDEPIYPELAYLYDPPVPPKGSTVAQGRGSSNNSVHGDTPLLPPLPRMQSLLPLQGVSSGGGVDGSTGAISGGAISSTQTPMQPQRRQLDILNEEDEDEAAAAAQNQPQSQPQSPTWPLPGTAITIPDFPAPPSAPPSVTLTTPATANSPAVSAARPLLSFSAHALKRKSGGLAVATTLPPFPPEGVLYHTPTHSGSSSNSGNGGLDEGFRGDRKGKGKGAGASEDHWDTIDLKDHGRILTPPSHASHCSCTTHNPDHNNNNNNNNSYARPSTSSSCASGSSCASNDGWNGPRSHRSSVAGSRCSKSPWWCPRTHIPTASQQLEEAERLRGRLTVRNGNATPVSGRSMSGGGRSARSSELEFADRRLLGREF